jgi:hypothetical protein
MIFRPVRVLLSSTILFISGLLVMAILEVPEPTCVDDLSELTRIASLKAQQGSTEPMKMKVGFDKELNQWCYIELIQ